MIEKRLLSLLGEEKKYIWLNVLVQWISLLAAAALMYAIALTMDALYSGMSGGILGIFALMAATGAMFVRYLCLRACSRWEFLSSAGAEEMLNEKLFEKADEEEEKELTKDTELLGTYCGTYLPQLIHAASAAATVFVILCLIDWKAALVLLCAAAVYLCAFMKRQTLKGNMFQVLIAGAHGIAALGVVVSLMNLKNHAVSIYSCLMVILMTAELFLVLNQLENSTLQADQGKAAAERFFAFLDRKEGKDGEAE